MKPVRLKKIMTMVLACATVISCLCVNAGAAQNEKEVAVTIAVRATGKFSMEVPGNTAVQASTSFPLEAGETVEIKATYSPFSANVDFGLIAPDGLFYSVNVTDGSVDQAIEIVERGNYTLAVRNNSSTTISVSGYVNY